MGSCGMKHAIAFKVGKLNELTRDFVQSPHFDERVKYRVNLVKPNISN